MDKPNITVGLLAHVDAGKTTLAEALLYASGRIRKLGRVDHKDTVMDTDDIERSRGITIFSSSALIDSFNDKNIYLVDTPGHVDFSAETERIISVMDYAILVISALDGVQAHTVTLFEMLKAYKVPVFIFVTKMDFARKTKEELIINLQKELNDNCIDFTDQDRFDKASMSDEDAMNEYLETDTLEDVTIRRLIDEKLIYPVWFGSGLKMEGVEEFLNTFDNYTSIKNYPNEPSYKIYKISRDPSGNRLTHLKVTGGHLNIKDELETDGVKEKVNQIRIYNGSRFELAQKVDKGAICSVTGPVKTYTGQVIGKDVSSELHPIVTPVMRYQIELDPSLDRQKIYSQLKVLEEEDPQLNFSYDPRLKKIYINLMGQIQLEVISQIIKSRFNIDVRIDKGEVLYKETILDKVEGVGHYEPLRHYSEVHLIMEPGIPGSGITCESKCPLDVLDLNWQRLILTHVMEKTHIGVVLGCPLTDVKITLASGRSHLKHTEGGDFRQSTYRAIRQGLMQAKTRILEPWYSFTIIVPPENVGRTINDLRQMGAEFETGTDGLDGSRVTGIAPVVCLNDYASTLASYTSGKGKLTLVYDGYKPCHNESEVIASSDYDPNSDLENPCDSVFCAHGAGFVVKWNEVKNYMHLESALKERLPYRPNVNRKNLSIDEKELLEIMEREFGKQKDTLSILRPTIKNVKTDYEYIERKTYYLIDGYNVIHQWDDLEELSKLNLEASRDRLIHILSNFSAFTGYEVVVVFDGKNILDKEDKMVYQGISVVYTKENQSADAYIEKMLSTIGKNSNISIVSSDSMIQLAALNSGAVRISSREFENQIAAINEQIGVLLSKQPKASHTIQETIDSKKK